MHVLKHVGQCLVHLHSVLARAVSTVILMVKLLRDDKSFNHANFSAEHPLDLLNLLICPLLSPF